MGDTKGKPEKIDISEILGPEAESDEDSGEIVILDPATGEKMPSAGPRDAAALRDALAEKDKYQDLWVRARADFENYRKRVERERAEERGRAAAELVRDLLPVADNLERALTSAAPDDPLREGLTLVHRQFIDCLTKAGLERIDALGVPFDPIYHEAVATEPTDQFEPNRVLAEIQKGYMFLGRVLRPSLVRVSISPAERSEGGSAGEVSDGPSDRD